MATKTKATAKKSSSKSRAKKSNQAELDKKNVKDTVTKTVETKRELKYNYPDGMKDTLERKRFRQKVRNKLYQYKRNLSDLKGKAKTKMEREYNGYRQEVLLVP